MARRFNGIEADPEGAYVLFTDYERLTARIKELESALTPFADAFGYKTSTPKQLVKDGHFKAAAKLLLKRKRCMAGVQGHFDVFERQCSRKVSPPGPFCWQHSTRRKHGR